MAKRDASNDDGTDYFHSLLTGLYWEQPSKKFTGTYQVQCGAGMTPLALRTREVSGWGSAFKKRLREVAVTQALMNMQGTLVQSPRKSVDLDPVRKDRFGNALPRLHLHYEDNDVAMARDCLETCEEVIRAAGGEVLSKPKQLTAAELIIDGNHWVGTCRMGGDPKTSVVNRDGQCHDVANLFIGDASVFTAYPEKNPTLTNIALSWRTSERLAEKMRRREI